MRIVLSFPGCFQRGGVERVVLESANFLGKRGHEVTLIASDVDPEALDSCVQVIGKPLPRVPFAAPLFFPRHARRMLDKMPAPDVHGGFGVMSPGADVIWIPSVHRRWLEVCREAGIAGQWRRRFNPFHHLILPMEARRYTKSNGTLLALSADVKRDLVRFYGVDESRIRILPNGFAPTEFNVSIRRRYREAMRAQLGFSSADPVVVFVANEAVRKGLWPLMQAIAKLRDTSVRLLIVGRLDATAIERHAKHLGLGGRITFVGPRSDVNRYYAAADVFALPTIYEAWGLVVVEAMACGLPALTSRLAGASEAIEEGTNGELLDDPADTGEIAGKLRQLLDGAHGPAEHIGQSVARYAWPEILQKYEDHLREASERRACLARTGGRTCVPFS